MSEPVNMVQLVGELPSRPRGRACIVLTHDYAGQKTWASELALQTDSTHIDLLERFSKDHDLSAEVSKFSIQKLFDFLKDQSDAQVLIISGMEFLTATWSGQANVLDQFAARVETLEKVPGLVFVLQYDKMLAAHEFRRFRQYTFVVDQKETLALI